MGQAGHWMAKELKLASPEVRFVELYDRFYDDVYRYCLRRTDHGSAEDVVARVFMTAWRRIDDVPEGDEGLYWLYRVAYRAVGHQWRGTSRRTRLARKLRGLGVETPVPPDDFVVQDEQSRKVLEATKHLNEVDREVLFLAVWEQLPQAQIAEILDISVGAVKQRLHRARKNLANAYQRLDSTKRLSSMPQRGGVL